MARCELTPARYPLAKEGVFRTLQGEGAWLGAPMIFVRFGGCSVGCPQCDTDYRPARRVTAEQLASEISSRCYGRREWVWLTGGEPTDHDLRPLIRLLRPLRCTVALATAGTRKLELGAVRDGPDWVSVSPHDPARWAMRRGDQVNLVPGLNGLSWADIRAMAGECEAGFTHRFVTPLAGDDASLTECYRWVAARPRWRLGVQCHKIWGLP